VRELLALVEHGGGRPVSDPAAPRVLDPEWIELSDGTRLCARVWLPAEQREPVPAILEYLPYRKDDATAADDALHYPYFAAHGYAGVRVDIRGSGDSDGLLLDEYSGQEQDDALEVIAWIAEQPWCDGSVGMMGISWSGFNSLQVAARRPPALRAIITACSTDDRYDNDVHYYGGCLLGYYMLPWASVMLTFNGRPPDPAIVGERWREMWLRRLRGNVDMIETWLGHQRRDEYWHGGSVCEDYDAIECPVLAVSGWADAYVDAVFRLLERLSCPRKAIVGPWGHQWPELGRPGPRIGFLQEAVRWWDRWLKGVENGVEDDPALRCYMQEAAPPSADAAEQPGRWISEPSWPPPAGHLDRRTLSLQSSGLREPPPAGEEPPRDAHDRPRDAGDAAGDAGDAAGDADDATGDAGDAAGDATGDAGDRTHARALRHRSPLTVGLDAGAWCAYGNPADLPLDQRRDDALSLTFDGPQLAERIELLGQPRLKLRIAADRPNAFVMARLCDLAPDGASTLITRGALNLCHHAGHDRPRALRPGVPVDAELSLRSIAYAVPAGHRLRLSLSTSYWPWLWPSPQTAEIALTCGESVLQVPVRARREEPEVVFGPPETAPPLPLTMLRHPRPRQLVSHDVVSGRVQVQMAREFLGARRLPSGLEYHDHDPVAFSIVEGDPLSAQVRCERTLEIGRGDWRTRLQMRALMTADAESFHVSSTLDAYEGQVRVHSRSSSVTIPRDHC